MSLSRWLSGWASSWLHFHSRGEFLDHHRLGKLGKNPQSERHHTWKTSRTQEWSRAWPRWFLRDHQRDLARCREIRCSRLSCRLKSTGWKSIWTDSPPWIARSFLGLEQNKDRRCPRFLVRVELKDLSRHCYRTRLCSEWFSCAKCWYNLEGCKTLVLNTWCLANQTHCNLLGWSNERSKLWPQRLTIIWVAVPLMRLKVWFSKLDTFLPKNKMIPRFQNNPCLGT